MKTISIVVPTPLRQYTDGRDTVQVAASTVSEALAALTDQHSALKSHLYSEDGQLRSFVNIYLNDEDVRYLEEGTLARLKDGDEMRIVPSIAGGVT
jgi:adenylyltransferase/sulfurtransferase